MAKDSIKILIIEDSDFDYELIERKLKTMKTSFLIKRADDEKNFRNLLDEFSPDLIISDYSMPVFSGIEALKIVNTSYPDIPFIFVSGKIGEELAIECLRQGAVDYVLKDNLDKIEPVITRTLNEIQEKKKRKDAEDKLKIAFSELKRINVDLDNFIYTASHDLKAPISNITGLLAGLFEELREEGEKNENIKNFKTMLDLSLDKFQQTINDLGKTAMAQKAGGFVEKINLLDFIEDVKISIADLINKNETTITTGAADCKEIIFSKKNLRSILYNLISNAIKYKSPARKSEVLIKCRRNETWFIIEVKDNGLGIKPENINDLFVKFKRFNDQVEGTGLGLYSIKRIIDNSGGKIEVESELGKGSVFRIYLPFKEK